MEENNVAQEASSEEGSGKEKDAIEIHNKDEENQEEVTNNRNVTKLDSLDDDNDSEMEQELQDMVQDLTSKSSEEREKALETLRHFELFLNECRSQFRVVSGEEKTHATNFRDVYTEWISRNRANRKHFGWDPDPPPPPPRKRGRSLNMYALKRQQMAKDKKQGVVTIAGKKYSARELFERKRLARRRARPLSLRVKIWRFFF